MESKKQVSQEAEQNRRDEKELSAYTDLLSGLNEYLRKKCRLGEHTLEDAISTYPISAWHNPFYGGAFNGNDCLLLLLNIPLLFDALHSLYLKECNEAELVDKIMQLADRFERVWAAWAIVMPSLCSGRLLWWEEQNNLLEDIKEFIKLYTKDAEGSISLKLHHLASHVK